MTDAEALAPLLRGCSRKRKRTLRAAYEYARRCGKTPEQAVAMVQRMCAVLDEPTALETQE